MDNICIDRYTLILKHEYIDGKGISHQIDRPFVLSCSSVDLSRFGCPPGILINEMLDRFKDELLKHLSQEAKQEAKE